MRPRGYLSLFLALAILAGCAGAPTPTPVPPAPTPTLAAAAPPAATAPRPPTAAPAAPLPPTVASTPAALPAGSPPVSASPKTAAGAAATPTAAAAAPVQPTASAPPPPTTPPTTPPATAATGGAWLSYNGPGLAVDPTAGGFSPPRPLWKSPLLDGDVYARPLVAGGRVYVATQANSLYALNLNDGTVVWRTTLGPPVPRSALPCGNVDPTGILSTPVLDPSGATLYAVDFVSPGRHELVVVQAETGKLLARQPADPPGANPLVQQQRSALVYANGQVYVAFGGLYGDCGPYHGWLVAFSPTDGHQLANYQVPTGREGAIWATSGPAVGGDGDLYVATGNSESTTTFDDGDAVLRLTPSLQLRSWFAPSNWAQLNASDADIGSVGPTLMSANLLFQIGKSGVGYLLPTNLPNRVGGEPFSAAVCRGAYGGTAAVSPVVYVPCTDGLVALRVDLAAPSFRVLWRGPASFAGPPLVSHGAVWTIDRNGTLFALDPATGQELARASLGAVTHFAAPTATGGRLYAPAARQIVAFSLG
jgi:outer membrane protein assembly factor BamB